MSLEKLYLDIIQIFDDYKVNKDKQFDKYKIGLGKKTLNQLNDEIKEANVDNIVIVMDSATNISHGVQVKSIIDTNLKDLDNIKTFYIPFKGGSGDDKISVHNAIQEIINQNQNKNIFINQSFTKDIITSEFNASLESLHQLKDSNLLNYIKESNKNTIELLNKNSNLNIIKSAGNNIRTRNDFLTNDVLKIPFDKITNNNYEEMKNISIVLNNIIRDSISGKDMSKEIKELKEIFKPIFKENNVSLDKFISLYINDYLIHYETNNLLEQSKNLKYDNLKIVEAFDEAKILENYTHYKEYHKEIPELEDYFNIYKKYKLDYSYNQQETKELKEFYEKNKDKYPEIFKISTFGTFSTFEHHDKEAFQRSVHKQDVPGLSRGYGTSFATPEVLSDVVKNNIDKNININYSLTSN